MSGLTGEDYRAIATGLTFSTTAFIDGHFRPAISGKAFDTINPATRQVLAQVAACGSDCAFLAVEKGCWSRLHPNERKDVLIRLAKLVKQNARELAVLELLDSGKTIICPTWHDDLIDMIYDQVAPARDNHVSVRTSST
jgi:gamma-glutamyl-gamma-aminobutyraldehyde dehydrogenase